MTGPLPTESNFGAAVQEQYVPIAPVRISPPAELGVIAHIPPDSRVAVGDFDRDGEEEIVVAEQPPTPSFYRFVRKGSGWTRQSLPPPREVSPNCFRKFDGPLLEIDWDGDGYPDLAGTTSAGCADDDSFLGLYRGENDRFIEIPGEVSTNSASDHVPSSLLRAEMIGGSLAELVVTPRTGPYSSAYFVARSSGGISAAGHPNACGPPGSADPLWDSVVSAIAGDVDGDGRDDLLQEFGFGRLSLWTSRDGHDECVHLPGLFTSGLMGLLDMNADGRRDVVLSAAPNPGYVVIDGDGLGAFGQPHPWIAAPLGEMHVDDVDEWPGADVWFADDKGADVLSPRSVGFSSTRYMLPGRPRFLKVSDRSRTVTALLSDGTLIRVPTSP